MQKDWDTKKVKTIHARFVDNWLINQATDGLNPCSCGS